MPLPAHLLPLTGSARWAVHGELDFNRWKKIWVYTHQCLSILNPGLLVVEITTTLSQSSAAVSE